MLLQTALGVETRSSRVSLSWRWRSSGTSAASDVGPATWSSQESTSASECVKRETFHSIWFACLTQKRRKLKLTCLVQFSPSSFSPDSLNFASDTLQQFFFYFSILQGWSAILWGRLPRPVWGEMWDLQQIHQWKGSGGENGTRFQHETVLTEI